MWLSTDDVICTGYLLLATLLHTTSSAATDVVRCYCNDATCVTTGYICKSLLGLCFTALPPQPAVMTSSSRHSQTNSSWFSASRGCVNEDMLSACTYEAVSEGNQPRLVCCHRDMCNYPDGLQRTVVKAPPGGDDIISGVESEYSNMASTTSHWTSLYHDVSSTDTWIRAALIAVPLTGLVILVVLVLIAARLLTRDVRSYDRRRHRLQRWSDVPADSRRIISVSGISPLVHAGCFINGSLDEKTPSLASEQLLYNVAGRHVTTGYDVINFYGDDVSDKLVNYHM